MSFITKEIKYFSWLGSNPESYILFSCCVFLISFNPTWCLRLSLSFLMWALLKSTGQLLCRLFLVGLCQLLPVTRFKFRMFGRNSVEWYMSLSVPGIRRHMLAIWSSTSNVHFDQLGKVVCARFLHQVIIFLSVIDRYHMGRTIFWKLEIWLGHLPSLTLVEILTPCLGVTSLMWSGPCWALCCQCLSPFWKLQVHWLSCYF